MKNASDEDIQKILKAKDIVSSAVHPETNEYIPRPMRLCSYAPISVPTLFGFLLSKPTTFNIIFWQWANQTYSAGVNYANCNKSNALTKTELFGAYMAAVSSSIGVGLGMK